jgi:hypothetical protein
MGGMNMRGSAWNHVAPIAVRSPPDPGDGRLLASSNRRRQLALELIENSGAAPLAVAIEAYAALAAAALERDHPTEAPDVSA